MEAGTVIGSSVERKEAWDKVTGVAKYTDDFIVPGILHAKLLTSPYAHAVIKSIDAAQAIKSPGVKAIITGSDFPILCGVVLEDHPPVATDKVRYFGEPVAIVVANSEREAMHAVKLIKVAYEPLPVVGSVGDAVKSHAPLIHENLAAYKHAVKGIYPEPNTNIADRISIRKGNMPEGWALSEVVAEAVFKLPKSDHIAMETRNARAEIHADGEVLISTSSQSPYSVKKMLSQYFSIDEGKVNVKTPLVGGGFGGKSPVQLELLAYMASKSVGGRLVKIANSREEDIVTSPCKLGLEARIKLGASRSGLLKAAEMTFLVDTGAYADIGPRLAKSIAIDCTGPYNIDNVWCDSLCVYTNHPYSTSFRSFGHVSYTFCIERAIDKLAKMLGMDPLEFRLRNALGPGQTTPTQVKTTLSNLGNLTACLKKLKHDIKWYEGAVIEAGNGKIRAKGISCLWKTSDSPTDSVSGIFLTFNTDGSINLNSGVVEIGPGMKTTLAQILAEKMKMDLSRIHIKLEVDTQVSPEHWKTVASMTTFMAGRATLRAAEDLMKQLRSLAALVMRCPPEDLDIAEEKVFLKQDPTIYVAFKDLVHGYKYPNGNAVEGQILGRGSFIMSHITQLDKETGKGKPGPAWTVGAQAVEVEFDKTELTYRILKACTVLDAGKVINPKTARGLITGGMSMGLGMGSREAFQYDSEGRVLNTSLRTYKVMHIGEEPEYIVDFVETPQIDAPYGARGISEHGIIGMPAALANALSAASGAELDELPITPEYIWKIKGGQA
ncbi:MAG TPA: xanthine dehydrogenase family protein molybdopterin-binding subunit [Clostridia bacterium]|nr:xanthine dehydrogenase family protein molybdopterin-binding subunit [Clostridia bacterium]